MQEREDRAGLVLELLWGKARPRARGPKPRCSLDEVVDAAIGIADRDGVGAATMQRVAQDLGFTKMAVYRYVSGQAELLALMIDRALGEPPPLDPVRGWRASLEVWAAAMGRAFAQHPWTLHAMAGVRPVGPNEASWMECGLRALAGTGLDAADKLDVLAVVSGHLRFVAQQADAAAEGATAEQQLLAALGRVVGPERFPELTRAVAQARYGRRADSALTFGLDCIFDGLASRLRRARLGGETDRRPDAEIGG